MSARLFLIHWNSREADELAAPLVALGWDVEIEAEDGARASTRILADPPDLVVIYLTRLPSHGRETAHYLRSKMLGFDLRIVFVGGAAVKVAAVRARVPEATYIGLDDLPTTLAALSNPQ